MAVIRTKVSASGQDGALPVDCVAHVSDCQLCTSLCRASKLPMCCVAHLRAGFCAQVSWLRAFLQHEPGKYVLHRKTNLAIAALLALVLALFITLTVVDKGPSHADRCMRHIITCCQIGPVFLFLCAACHDSMRKHAALLSSLRCVELTSVWLSPFKCAVVSSALSVAFSSKFIDVFVRCGQACAVAGNPAWAVWVHNAVAAVKVQLQTAREVEMAAVWHLCSQHDCMRCGLHCGGGRLLA